MAPHLLRNSRFSSDFVVELCRNLTSQSAIRVQDNSLTLTLGSVRDERQTFFALMVVTMYEHPQDVDFEGKQGSVVDPACGSKKNEASGLLERALKLSTPNRKIHAK